MNDRGDTHEAERAAGPIIAAAAIVAAACWLVPVAVALLYSGRWPEMNVVEAATGTVRVFAEGRWSDPAAAYPRRAQTPMPAAVGWWASVAWLFVTASCAAVGTWRRLEPLAARERLGRRPYDLRVHVRGRGVAHVTSRLRMTAAFSSVASTAGP